MVLLSCVRRWIVSIQGRSARLWEFERDLERFAPVKKKLTRALAYNCPNLVPNRNACSEFCPLCGGTGYTPNTPQTAVYFMFADLQPGHGIYGSGGNFIQLVKDLGRLDIGDAVMFCKVINHDYKGNIFAPRADSQLIRPDLITAPNGDTYNVTRVLPMNVGDDTIGLACTLSKGLQLARGNA